MGYAMTETINEFTTVFHQMHIDYGAKMVPFAGYDMPVSYPPGVKKEHLHTREKAGLFDVSHMGQVKLIGENAKNALESLVPVDIIDLPLMKQRYALFTNDNGGVLDDLMVTNIGNDCLLLVVNAGCKRADFAHLQHLIGNECEVKVLEDYALLALQGPQAGEVLAALAPESREMTFMTAKVLIIDGVECLVTRSGYSGEDGFEISLHNDQAQRIAKCLLAHEVVEWIGLGARDSLRLEAGLSLYGHELDTEHSPVESSLVWALSKVRRSDGARAGGYPGATTIMNHIEDGVAQKIVGLQPQGRAPVRDGVVIVDDKDKVVGKVTSGGFGPTTGKPIVIARIDSVMSDGTKKLSAIVREKKVVVEVVKLPFVKSNYYRG
jgi:aminomethyltransferase